MKRKQIIPQHEFSFAAENFNLAAEETADGARIQSECEQSARDRAESEANQCAFEDAAIRQQRFDERIRHLSATKTVCRSCRALIPKGDTFCSEACRMDYNGEFERIPGLAPGSSWTVDRGMSKALATMQGDR